MIYGIEIYINCNIFFRIDFLKCFEDKQEWLVSIIKDVSLELCEDLKYHIYYLHYINNSYDYFSHFDFFLNDDIKDKPIDILKQFIEKAQNKEIIFGYL